MGRAGSRHSQQLPVPLHETNWGPTETLIGLALTVATQSELTVSRLSGGMLAALGTGRMLAASIVAMVIRMLAYFSGHHTMGGAGDPVAARLYVAALWTGRFPMPTAPLR